MTTGIRILMTLPAPVLGGPPLILAVAFGLTRHHLRTRRNHR